MQTVCCVIAVSGLVADLFVFFWFKGLVALGLVYDTVPSVMAKLHQGTAALVGNGLNVPFPKGVECQGDPRVSWGLGFGVGRWGSQSITVLAFLNAVITSMVSTTGCCVKQNRIQTLYSASVCLLLLIFCHCFCWRDGSEIVAKGNFKE